MESGSGRNGASISTVTFPFSEKIWSKHGKILTLINSDWRLPYHIILYAFYLYLDMLIVRIITEQI